ncbi:MAG: hypothetical protein ACK5HT_16780 [Draconibacterium sp.]
MKKQLIYILSLTTLVLLQACATPKYFHDPLSLKRQKELRQSRSANVVFDIGATLTSSIVGAALDTEVTYEFSDQQFKKIKLLNISADTMYINMLTDVYWDEDNYCDFMDIRIPPMLGCKVMVPIDANYHLYFSNTPESEDDEMLEIYTSSTKRVKLVPGMTQIKEEE